MWLVCAVLTVQFFVFGSGDASADEVSLSASSQEQPFDWLALPVVLYTPETSLLFAAAALFVLPNDDPKRDSDTIKTAAFYTLKNQLMVGAKADFYPTRRSHLHLNPEFALFRTRFYGIGNDTVESVREHIAGQRMILRASASHTIWGDLSLGLLYEGCDVDVQEAAADGMLVGEGVSGSAGGLSSGVGVLLRFDDRDDLHFPRRGGLYEASFTDFAAVSGSDFDFLRARFDGRSFFELADDHVFGVHGLFEVASGDPPFAMMAKLGGTELLRGIYRGRYRDRNALALEVEYRWRVWWRLGLAGFAGVGQVAHDVDSFAWDGFHPTGGGGLRVLVSERNNVSVRLDAAFSTDSQGVYFNVGEAF